MGSSLEQALNEIRQPRIPGHISPHLLRKQTRREKFADISFTNTQVVRELVSEVRRLNKNGNTEEAKRLIAIAEKILENNDKFQNMVGEVLSNSD